MSGAWSHRIVRDDKGLLHFAAVRFRPMEDTISGLTEIWNTAESVDQLRSLAEQLLKACDAGIIDMADRRDPDRQEDEDDEWDETGWSDR